MKTIQATATVTPDGTLTLRVPADILPGEHQVVLVIEETPGEPAPEPAAEEKARPFDFPVIHVGKWPENLSLRREDMDDEWGR